MKQVRYPQLRLAHLFMLNATPWEARLCHREYRNPFFPCLLLPLIAGSVLFTCQTFIGIHVSDHWLCFSLSVLDPVTSCWHLCFLFFLIQIHIRALFHLFIYFIHLFTKITAEIMSFEWLLTSVFLSRWLWDESMFKSSFGPYTNMKSQNPGCWVSQHPLTHDWWTLGHGNTRC